MQIDEIAALTGAREHRLFTGRLEKHRLSFGERTVVRAVRAPEGYFRDWDDVAECSRAIAHALEQ